MDVIKSPTVAGSRVNPVLNALNCKTLCKNTDTANNAPASDKLVIKRIPIPLFKLWSLSKLTSTRGFSCLISYIPKLISKTTDIQNKIPVINKSSFKYKIPKRRQIKPLTHD